MSEQPVCVTCSDVATCGRVIDLLAGHRAIVDVDGVVAEISVALVDVALGDVVLVHAAEAIGKLS
jgi:hydrogenase expression/formation protein HypC